jgi:hypothetical protein
LSDSNGECIDFHVILCDFIFSLVILSVFHIYSIDPSVKATLLLLLGFWLYVLELIHLICASLWYWFYFGWSLILWKEFRIISYNNRRFYFIMNSFELQLLSSFFHQISIFNIKLELQSPNFQKNCLLVVIFYYENRFHHHWNEQYLCWINQVLFLDV